MSEVTFQDYLEFLKQKRYVEVGGVKIPIGERKRIKTLQPLQFELPKTTIWNFPERGDWATHSGSYRGNWDPNVVRSIILKYSREGELVLDQMMGSGTTLIEARLLNRNAIGLDINFESVILTIDRLNFPMYNLFEISQEPLIKTYLGDARNLNLIKDESVDLIATHPPYADIIVYKKENPNDLSNLKLEHFLNEMRKVALECFRVLKPDKYCAILIGDTRQNKFYIPLSYKVLNIFLECGFKLMEDIIHVQYNTRTTERIWVKMRDLDFCLIYHEHLFIFKKDA